jgi:hypothetical protein
MVIGWGYAAIVVVQPVALEVEEAVEAWGYCRSIQA